METDLYKKVENMKEKQSKLDRNLIIKMYNDGMKKVDISKFFNASKSTISMILNHEI